MSEREGGHRRQRASIGIREAGRAQAAERQGQGARVRVSRGRAQERGAKDLVEESRGEGYMHHTYLGKRCKGGRGGGGEGQIDSSLTARPTAQSSHPPLAQLGSAGC